MTKDFKDWWLVFVDGVALFSLFIFSLLIKLFCLLLWLPTMGYSTKWYASKVGDVFPDYEVDVLYSPTEPILNFYNREPWLAIHFGSKDLFCDNVELYIKRPKCFLHFASTLLR